MEIATEALAIDVPSPVPGPFWRTLRGWLDESDLEFEPNLHTEHGLLGYAVRLRTWLIGVGLSMRTTGPALTLTAVLCRGMDREQVALAAVDRANAKLAIGQILYFTGPPAELSFFTSVSFDLVDRDIFTKLFAAMVQELNNVGFPAVMQVRGYHPTDHAAPWGDPMHAPFDDETEELPLPDDPPCQETAGDDRPAEPTPVSPDSEVLPEKPSVASRRGKRHKGPAGSGTPAS